MKHFHWKRLCLRGFLGILILCNLLLIFHFSSEDATKSGKTSMGVTETVAEVIVPNYQQKTEEEKTAVRNKLHLPMRKFAHMSEFASLCALVFLFLFTWSLSFLRCSLFSLLFSFLCACADEFHQIFSEGRGPSFTDVLIDTSGAVLAILFFLLLFSLISHQKRKIKNANYEI